MEHGFWLSRWGEGKIGFHQDAVHSDLLAEGEALLAGGPHDVLVPLCGKTHDLDWIAARGHRVVGVDLSSVARDAVVERLGGATQDTLGGFERARTTVGDGSVTFLVGDVHGLATLDLRFDRVWDRAALVALPPDMRGPYVALLRRLVRPGGRVLLNHFSYDQTRMDGPPFSVPPAEVEDRYTGWTLEHLRTATHTEGKFIERGLASFTDHLVLATKPG